MVKWLRMLAALCALAGVGLVHGQAPAPVPVESFFKPAKFRGALLSPSGRWLAAMTSEAKQRVGLLIVDTEGKEPSRFVGAGEKDDMVWFRWVNEDWLVFSLDDADDRRTYGLGSGLMAMSRDGKSSRMLIAREWEEGADPFRRRQGLEPNHRFAALGAPGTREVIITEQHYGVDRQYEHSTLKAVDVSTGQTRTLPGDLPRADSWWFDAQGRPRVASYRSAGNTTFYWADEKTGAWREIAKAPTFRLPFIPQYVAERNTLVVSTSDAKGHLELRQFDFDTGRPAADTLLTTPGFDGGAAPFRQRGSGEVLGVSLAVDADTSVWFTPAMRALQAKVDARFPRHVNQIVGCQPCDASARVVLVHSHADVDPGFVALFRPQEDKWQLVGSAQPDIDPARMARLAFHRTQARDGLDLPVWVTRLPALISAGKPAPAVVLVHGGPMVRGTDWDWNPQAQFLASRGYVVIEPEFRGGEGYGDMHTTAGFKQWGLAMQDDVTDALRFAVQRGWVDPARVCIMGASYGGYAALWGVAKDPDQYRCAVAHVAVTDPRNMFDFFWSDISDNAKTYSLAVTLGDRKADDAKLAAVSPVEQAARIKVPVLLSHGGADRRVPVQNGERMRDALQKLGKPVEWVLYADEGHGFRHLENKVDYHRRVEAFLARHLK
ncbi:MAG: prolyl oligopeptidase family serine peptidase [Rubrivivax sp.]|nr:prolyl oligopeptidase family serine peptidase [Rubrivivax sp.]